MLVTSVRSRSSVATTMPSWSVAISCFTNAASAVRSGTGWPRPASQRAKSAEMPDHCARSRSSSSASRQDSARSSHVNARWMRMRLSS